MKDLDVYAYGVVAASVLHLLSQPFPQPDGYAEIAQTYFMTGGEALNSAIVLSRLGLRVQLDGNWIGDTPEGERLLATIQRCGIDTRRLRVKKGFSGVREVVFSDQQSRTIFGNYIDLLFSTRKWNIPKKVDLARARIICIDPPFRDESALVGKYALELGIPFVSVDSAYHQLLATDAAAVIVSGEFRSREYPLAETSELFSEYQARAQGLVVLTTGDGAVLYGRRGGPVRQFKPFRVNVVDSAGAGDSFRAGVIYGMLKQWPDDRIIEYATALAAHCWYSLAGQRWYTSARHLTAAMVCERFPGVLNSPTHTEVMQFIQARKVS